MKLIHIQSVIMPYREIDGGHAVKIGTVEPALPTRSVAHRLSENFRQQINHRIKHRYIGNAPFLAATLELGPQILIDDTHQKNPGIAVHAGKDSVDMIQTAHQRPHMFGCPHVRELRDAGTGDLMHGFTR